MPKKIKTLLFCKVNPVAVTNDSSLDYAQAYKSIYTPAGAKKYITIGNFDALCVYEPAQIMVGEKWFYKLYADKQNVIFEMNDKLSYHPIHLIANAESEINPELKENAKICMITLVYGVDTKTNTDLSGSQEDSDYERIIKDCLGKQAIETDKITFEVYNAINICDAVIIWYTNDLQLGHETALRVGKSGIARKTFTITGLTMNDEGSIAEETYKALGGKTANYSIRMQGSVRKQNAIHKLVKEITDALKLRPKALQRYATFGSEDFSLYFPNLSGEGLEKLLRFLITPKNGRTIATACWEIHTEFLLESNINPPKKEVFLMTQILSGQYQKILKQFVEMGSDFYPWKSAFLELISVHANIDRTPILYGPSYLLYDFIRVALTYCKNEYFEVLQNSQETIESFIRNWSQLTDQTTRIDDLIFRGFGSTSAIYNTLPESALDFLHAFLHKYVDVLITLDGNDNRKPKEPIIYDFLLVPEMNQRMRICPMFDVSTLYQKQVEEVCRNCDNCRNNTDIASSRCWRNTLWPAAQAYLVEFPTKNVYHPAAFFAPLAHECFHFFGDAFRLREKRADYMAAFLAARVIAYLKLDKSDELNEPYELDENVSLKCLLKELYRHIHLSPAQTHPGIHLKDTMRALYRNLRNLFSYDTWKTIYNNENVILHYLGRDNILKQWADARVDIEKNDLGFWAQTAADCGMFFKECFADTMMIVSLQISPGEYLSLFEDDLAPSATKTGEHAKNYDVSIAQRIAIVLSACCNRYGESGGVINDTEWIGKWSIEHCTAAVINAKTRINSAISDCFQALVADKAIPSNQKIYPVYVLNYVKEYLTEVLETFDARIAEWDNNPNTNTAVEELREVREQFDGFFRQEKLFSREYYRVIRSHHDYVRQCVNDEQ